MRRAILLVDHGSRRPGSNALLDEVAELLSAALPDCLVRAAHMEIAAPSIADGRAACVAAGAHEIVVAPYFLGPGRHALEDVPRLAREAAARHPGLALRVADPLGAHPGIVHVLLDRIAASRDVRAARAEPA